ncbi:T-cell immunoglobulin and mucin domain-containing protein 4 isoform X1 [Phyllostomus discolor]|uniref:T-cell immunoglobulin and mucin domain-containing protein 4 isoform X1 n=1 Tax=Phyllostomus discolor TaxID=89673 RepID=UPI0016582653|nr:T-cell immunoglobulin and mucin domain-containing protein 4 isoform X1 [Phyllostomus discolor]
MTPSIGGWFLKDWLHLTPAAAETVVTAFLGQPATLPCYHQSWSVNSNSMCWGKGPCPNSRCTEELLHTDGSRVLSRKSTKYDIRGYIPGGDISLTIFNTRESDSAVYCCRIEVPGWFNDIKKNIRLQVQKAPMTTRRPTTRRPTTTTTTTTTTTIAMTTTTVTPPTTVLTTSDLPTTPPLRTRPTTALTVATTTCPLEAPSTLPEATKSPPTTEPATEEPVFTAESENSFLPKATSGDTPRETKGWVLQSTSQALTSKRRDPAVPSQPKGSETTTFGKIKAEKKQVNIFFVIYLKCMIEIVKSYDRGCRNGLGRADTSKKGVRCIATILAQLRNLRAWILDRNNINIITFICADALRSKRKKGKNMKNHSASSVWPRIRDILQNQCLPTIVFLLLRGSFINIYCCKSDAGRVTQER